MPKDFGSDGWSGDFVGAPETTGPYRVVTLYGFMRGREHPMMLRWWMERRRRKRALRVAAGEWMARHGRYASGLASVRSMDAYLLGDLQEQEYWGQVREIIDESESETRPSGGAASRRPE